eukprot:CAMPEP_0194480446 /NCGR_PEP_ID=MMETSP0253-20130528/3240_1 /TAXON_ID=2966 /ORGANISM="Noctiluca scintillans" /LENGTH=530 /DNA_ID=CAMNT_0039319829 /DNA_START=45 /DNA_END=1637 /DNA_ORIENTATION=+
MSASAEKLLPTAPSANGNSARGSSEPSSIPTVHGADHTPAYKALHEADLIVNTYRVVNVDHLQLEKATATLEGNMVRRVGAYFCLICGGIVYDAFIKQFTVRDAHIRKAVHNDGRYLFFGPGVHRVPGYFLELKDEVHLTEQKIVHGNRAIVTVPQGFVGLCFDRGQPVLLPPGMHQWTSDTLELKELIDLSHPVIYIGPFTLVTVDEGYAAISQDNGRQRILAGGATYMLMHRNWKFQKFISLKIRTDDLGPFEATSADNVVLKTSATVNWRVEDAVLASKMAADTMVATGPARTDASHSGPSPGIMRGFEDKQGGTPAIRSDVLKQAIASLAAAMGSVRYADDVGVAASDAVTVVDASLGTAKPQTTSTTDELFGVAQIFSVQQMSTAVQHANEICVQYGVRIISISVISAVPVDKKLDEALSAGAVASAGAQQAEIAARGNAKARLISSQSEAEAIRITAMAMADAERLQAQGKKDAAQLLESSAVAVDLAKLEKGAQLIGDKATYFFGAGPQDIAPLLSNPKVVGK